MVIITGKRGGDCATEKIRRGHKRNVIVSLIFKQQVHGYLNPTGEYCNRHNETK